MLPSGTIGPQITYYRESHQLTQVMLAATVGIRPGHLSNIETGRSVPGMTTIARLAVALGVSIGDLVGHS